MVRDEFDSKRMVRQIVELYEEELSKKGVSIQ